MGPILCRVVPGAELVTIAGAGHFIQEDAGEQLGAAIARFALGHHRSKPPSCGLDRSSHSPLPVVGDGLPAWPVPLEGGGEYGQAAREAGDRRMGDMSRAALPGCGAWGGSRAALPGYGTWADGGQRGLMSGAGDGDGNSLRIRGWLPESEPSHKDDIEWGSSRAEQRPWDEFAWDLDPGVELADEAYRGRRRSDAPAARLWIVIAFVLIGSAQRSPFPWHSTRRPTAQLRP